MNAGKPSFKIQVIIKNVLLTSCFCLEKKMLRRLCAFTVILFLWNSLIAAEDVAFVSDYDKSEQRYLLILPESFDATVPTDLMIFLHGHGSDRNQINSDLWNEIRMVREKMEEYKTILISPDYRATTSWMGPAAEADTLQILADIKKRFAIRRVIFIGGSMGGSSSLTFAALHPDLVDGVIAFNPLANHLTYDNFQDAITESFGGTKQEKTMEYKNRSAEYFPERFTMPVAITIGGADVTVPPDSAKRLAETIARLQPNSLLIDRPETGHTTSAEDAATAIDFVFNHLN